MTATTKTKSKQREFVARWVNGSGETKVNVFVSTAAKVEEGLKAKKNIRVYSMSSKGVRTIPLGNPTITFYKD